MKRQTPNRVPLQRKRQGTVPSVTQNDALEVSLRIRPLVADEEGCMRVLNDRQVSVTMPECSVAYARTQVSKEYEFLFRHVFEPGSLQRSVFEQTALGFVEDLVRGRNGVLFTYGATCSGKTYTMVGSPSEPGLLPRVFDVLFNTVAPFQAAKYQFKPDRLNGFEVQSEVDALIERQKRDVAPAGNKQAATNRCGALRSMFERTAVPTPCEPSTTGVERERQLTTVSGVDGDWAYGVFVSFFEIYNDSVYDLLDDECFAEGRQPARKPLREDTVHGSMYVVGGTELEVCNSDEAYALLQRGVQRRKVAHTLLNAESSRSHSVFTVRLVQGARSAPSPAPVLLDKDALVVSQLSLVDLAGSERAARTRAAGDRLKEAGNINESLAYLKQCMDVLRRNQARSAANTTTTQDVAPFREVPPYRNCKLTHLFKAFFDSSNAGRMAMLVCVNPATRDFDESIQVLQFAVQAQDMHVSVVSNVAEKKEAVLTREREKEREREKRIELERELAAAASAASCAKRSRGGAKTDESDAARLLMLAASGSNETPPSSSDEALTTSDSDAAPLPPAPTRKSADRDRTVASFFEMPFPPHKLNVEEADSQLLTQLGSYLSLRCTNRSLFSCQFDRRLETFRQMLLDYDEQMTRLQSENRSLQGRVTDALRDLQVKEETQASLERKFNELERRASEWRGSATRFDSERADLRRAIDERETRLRAATDEARRIARERDTLKRQLDAAQRRLDDQASNTHRLRLVRAISEADPGETDTELRKADAKFHAEAHSTASASVNAGKPPPSPSVAPAHSVALRAARWNNATSSVTYHFPAASEQDLRKADAFAMPGHTSRADARPPPKPTVTHRSPSPAAATAASSGLPVVAKNTRRRSKSAENEVWLDHRPAAVQPVDALFQTRMRKRISTSKLKVSETHEASKYVLTHQQASSNGTVETQLFKGDVLPSMTGGTRVVLNQVETLRLSPTITDRKRHATTTMNDRVAPFEPPSSTNSSAATAVQTQQRRLRSSKDKPAALAESDSDVPWTDTETRCAVAVEGHPNGTSSIVNATAKRLKHSQV